MIVVECPQCGKRYKVDERARGSKAKCKCGVTVIVGDQVVPQAKSTESSCPSCSKPVRPEWNACAFCGTSLASTGAAPGMANAPSTSSGKPGTAPGKRADKSPSVDAASNSRRDQAPAAFVIAGNDSIVKATIDAGVPYPAGRSGDGGDGRVTGRDAPVMAIGDNAIVKANIDARQQVFNDQSTTVHGQYVGQQTFVHVGSIVQRLTVSFSSEAASEIEKSLPDDLPSLIAIVANTCRWLIRNDLVRAKQHVAGGLHKVVSHEHDRHGVHKGKLFAKQQSSYELAEEAILKRHELCDRAVGRVHEIANATGDQSFLADIEELDDCVLGVKQSHRDVVWLDNVKGGWHGEWSVSASRQVSVMGALGYLAGSVMLIVVGVAERGPGGQMFQALGSLMLLGAPVVLVLSILFPMRKAWRVEGTQESLVEDLPGLEQKLSRLVSRYEFRVPVINLLCAVACVDGAIQSMEAAALRAAMVDLDYAPTDRILRDIMSAWRSYLTQGTAVSMLDSVLNGIEPLAGTEEGRRVWNAAISIAESNGGIDAREGAFLRKLKDVLEIHEEEKKRTGWRGLLGG